MKSACDWIEEKYGQAKVAFANHRLKVVGPGHWQIRRPNESYFWTDIVVMGGVGLAVWGDIDGCFFSYYSGAKYPEQLVAWIAGAGLGQYLVEKAYIGMGGELVHEYPASVLEYDIKGLLAEGQNIFGWADSKEDEKAKKIFIEAQEEALESLKNGEHYSVIHAGLHEMISEYDQDCSEWIFDTGRVISSRVIYAAAAVSKLHELLKEKENAEEEKRECGTKKSVLHEQERTG